MATTTYIGTVLEDGHLLISQEAMEDLELTVGDKIEIMLRKISEHEEAEYIEALRREVEYTFPDKIQGRLEELLYKKREGQITPDETAELNKLVLDVQIQTVRRAQAMYLLKQHDGNVG